MRYEIKFKLNLLEDMHSGSGMGLLGIIDDTHARNSQGKPVVWGTTLKGLLREKAEELHQLLPEKFSQEKIIRLFGTEAGYNRGGLICGDIVFEKENKVENYFRINFSTSREVHSRSAEAKTLRCIEMASAGLIGYGQLQLSGNSEDCEFVKTLLQRLTSLGGRRSRGLGQVKLEQDELKISKIEVSQKVKDETPGYYKILLKAKSPVCCADSGYAGNIINTSSFISGSQLRGALLTTLSQEFPQYKNHLQTIVRKGQAGFENALPLPENYRKNLFALELEPVPMPLTAAEKKQNEQVSNQINSGIVKPWWADKNKEYYWEPGSNEVQIDNALNKNNTGSDQDTKRIKTEDFLLFDLQNKKVTPLRYRAQKTTILRNRVPVHRFNLKNDSRRKNAKIEDLAKEEGSLFSIENLSENQYFLGKFYCEDSAGLIPELLQNLVDKCWLRIGRGGQPVQICGIEKIKAFEKESENLQDHLLDFSKDGDLARGFLLTLVSDTIVRDTSLNFKDYLEINDLFDEYSLKDCEIEPVITEMVKTRNYNSAASGFNPAKLAIKRGSVFKVMGDSSQLSTLLKHLNRLQCRGKGIGEDVEIGFGRFFVNLPVHIETKWSGKVLEHEPGGKIDEDKLRREKIAEEAVKIVEDATNNKAQKLTRSQLNFLRSSINACQSDEDIYEFFSDLQAHSRKNAGKNWGKAKIGDKTLMDYFKWCFDKNQKLYSDIDKKKFFVDIFARYQLARMGGK